MSTDAPTDPTIDLPSWPSDTAREAIRTGGTVSSRQQEREAREEAPEPQFTPPVIGGYRDAEERRRREVIRGLERIADAIDRLGREGR